MTQSIRNSLTSLRNGVSALRRRAAFLAFLLAGIAAISYADGPMPGLSSRATVGAYMNGLLPSSTSLPMPALLSQTGVFTSMAARTPHPGFVPYALNSPLWTDGAEKFRFIAIPFNSAMPEDPVASPKIGFAPTGNWTFPNGTVIIKSFDMQLDERATATDPPRRLETRILIRNADGTIRGATYRWRDPVGGVYSEADLVPAHLDTNPPLNIIQPDGSTRQQVYTFPGPDECVRCHNGDSNPNNIRAGMVLGIRTAQLNGNFNYSGGTDNQLNTWAHLGMFNTAIANPSTYARAVDVMDTTATLELRVRSYLASNCSHCHRDGGEGGLFKAEFERDILTMGLVSNGGFGGLIRDDLLNSRLFARDSSTSSPMPPVARNLPDARIVGAPGMPGGVYGEWVNYGYDVMTATRQSATQVRLLFNLPVDAATALLPGNYTLDNGATVSQVTADGADAVVLTTGALVAGTTYNVTINRVRELQAPQNPIWPNTSVSFTTPAPTVPGAPTLTGIQAGNAAATLSFMAPASDGGAPISSYQVDCTNGSNITANGAGSPITVTGLTGGSLYTCSVRATNSAGQGPASNALTVTPVTQTPVLVKVMSRKMHGTAGAFDLALDVNAAINGAVTIEPRSAATHQIVFRFDIPVMSAGTTAATSGSTTTSIAGNEVIVTLANVSDAQRVKISVPNINGTATNVSVSLGFLAGDVNGSRGIDAVDVSAMKARTGSTVDEATFRYDLNVSGTITASEVAAVKARVNRTLN